MEKNNKIKSELAAANKLHNVKIRLRKLKEGYRIYFDVWRNNRRDYTFTSFFITGKAANLASDRAIVKAAMRERDILESSSLVNDEPQKQNIKADIRFGLYLEAFAKQNKRGGLVTLLNNWQAFSDAKGLNDLQIGKLTAAHCQSFIKYLVGKNYAPGTIRLTAKELSAALKHLLKNQIITVNPAAALKLPKVPAKSVKFLSVDELQKLFSTPYQTNYDIAEAFEFAVNTGLRQSDLYNLQFGQIVNSTLSIQQKKTSESVSIPLNTKALEILHKQAAKHSTGLVFNLPSKPAYFLHLKAWGVKAGLSIPLTSHVARHSCAVLMLSSGVSLYHTSLILGHSSSKTTELFYADIAAEARRKAVDTIQY